MTEKTARLTDDVSSIRSSLEEQRNVPRSRVHRCTRDNESHNTHHERPGSVPKFLLGAVAVPAVDEGDKRSEDPGWGGHAQSLVGREAQGGRQGREVAEQRGRADQ